MRDFHKPASNLFSSSSNPSSLISDGKPGCHCLKRKVNSANYNEPLTRSAGICIFCNEPVTVCNNIEIRKGRGKEVDRGGTLERHSATSTSPARAGPPNRKANISLEVDSNHIDSSTGWSGSSSLKAVPEGRILEGSNMWMKKDTPNPISGLCRTDSNRIQRLYIDQSSISNGSPSSQASISNSCKRPQQNAFNRSSLSNPSSESQGSLFNSYNQSHPMPEVHPEVLHQALLDLTHIERSLSRSPSPRIMYTRSLAPDDRRFPTASQMPAEVLEQVYRHLGPVDFNSARHVCWLWYVKSLQKSLLETMLERGGWSSSVQRDRIRNQRRSPQLQEDDIWLMSKHIARECALSPHWKGNGLSLGFYGESAKTPLVHVATTNMAEVGMPHPFSSSNGLCLRFTVSACGKFLMITCEYTIYIYELNCTHRTGARKGDKIPGALRPITSIICPRKVLSCSMDTSFGRYAIGVLMEERMGLVCSLRGNFGMANKRHFQFARIRQEAPSRRHKSKSNSQHISTTSRRFRERRSSSSQIEGRAVSDFASIPVDTPHPFSASQATPPSSFSDYQRPEAYWPYTHGKAYIMHIEQSSPTVYHPLASADDPPRSVAICPQRRCVAFGCSSGVELHWIDANSGGEVSRWFPLTAPCDYLYFLPPRAGIDNVKKLRLISSDVQPIKHSTRMRFHGSRSGSHGSKRTSPSPGILTRKHSSNWLGFGTSATSSRSSRFNGEHYRAIPLSDGYHILFTDPASGLLCFGIDAPVGSPTKLLRKIWLKGPTNAGSPLHYAVGTDLNWGVRIVAAYDCDEPEQNICLFSIPYDVYIDSMYSNESDFVISKTTAYDIGGHDQVWLDWWHIDEHIDGNDQVQREVPTHAGRKHIWPMQIRGQEIGRHCGITELAIDSSFKMIVWAFGSDGTAKVWHLDDSRRAGSVVKRFVLADGNVREEDAAGDIEMPDALPESRDPPERNDKPQAPSLGYYDGTGAPLEPSNKRRKVGAQSFRLDPKGDVLMGSRRDHTRNRAARVWNKSLVSTTLAHDTFDASYPAEQRDRVGVSTGMARVDVNIH